MHGAEKIFIHGEQIARQRDLDKEKADRLFQIQDISNYAKDYTDQQINAIPEPDPQIWVDSGFTYKTKEQGTAPIEIIVEPYGTSGYTFEKQADNYYHANNLGIDDSYAMAKIRFINNSTYTYKAYVELMRKSEAGADSLVVSMLDYDLEDSLNSPGNVETSLTSGEEETMTIEKDIAPGEHTLTVRYAKDGSISLEGEYAKFRSYVQNYIIKEETKHVATMEYVNDKVSQAGSGGGITAEADPIFAASPAASITVDKITSWDNKANASDIPTVPTNISDLTNDAGYLTSESDPTVPTHVKNITQADITNWNAKADLTAIPPVITNISDLNNDTGFITAAESLDLNKTTIAPVSRIAYELDLMRILRNLCSVIVTNTFDISKVGSCLAKSSFCFPTVLSKSYSVGQPALFESIEEGSFVIDSSQTLKAGKAGTYDIKLTYKMNNIMAFGTSNNEVTSLQIVWAVYEIYLNKDDLKSDSTNNTDFAIIQAQWCREAFNYEGTA